MLQQTKCRIDEMVFDQRSYTLRHTDEPFLFAYGTNRFWKDACYVIVDRLSQNIIIALTVNYIINLESSGNCLQDEFQ